MAIILALGAIYLFREKALYLFAIAGVTYLVSRARGK